VLQTLRDGGVDVRLLPKDEANSRCTIHSKYLLVDSPCQGANGVRRRRLVFTGSHNWTAAARRDNDEVMLRVDDDAVFAAFRANWDAIRVRAR
jgi:phosphatidylserine/phosphatidylglycerophosphate/cardiolipin synthase-like enzyme